MKQMLFVASLNILVFCFTAAAQENHDGDLKVKASRLHSQSANLLKLEPIKFEYNSSYLHKFKLPAGTQFGFSAAELAKVFPELVREEKKFIPNGKNSFKTVSIKAIDMESLIPVLISAFKEQQEEIARLKTELEALKIKSAAAK